MIIAHRDPASMSMEERLFEVAAIMARGYLRLVSSKEREQKALAQAQAAEAHCYTVVNDERAGSDVEAVA